MSGSDAGACHAPALDFNALPSMLFVFVADLGQVVLRNESLFGQGWADVVRLLQRRQFERLGSQILVRNESQQMADDVEACGFFVVRVDDVPGRLAGVGDGEHFVLGAGIVGPAAA